MDAIDEGDDENSDMEEEGGGIPQSSSVGVGSVPMSRQLSNESFYSRTGGVPFFNRSSTRSISRPTSRQHKKSETESVGN